MQVTSRFRAGRIDVLRVTGDPDGFVKAPPGSIAIGPSAIYISSSTPLQWMSAGGGGGGPTDLGSFTNYAALTTAHPAGPALEGNIAYVQNSTGIYLINRKNKGWYSCDGSAWVPQEADDKAADAIAALSIPLVTDYYFVPSGVINTAPVFNDWEDLCVAIAALPFGVAPSVTFTENFTIPSAGMPGSGWDQKLGIWKSPITATGVVQVVVPDGVFIRNLVSIDVGLQVEFQPTTADGPLRYDITPGLNLLMVGLGGKLVNTGSKALILSSGTGDTSVIALNGATQIVAPFDTAPWLKVQGTDGVIAINFVGSYFSQFPDEWLTGGSAGSLLIYNIGITFIEPVLSSWTGDPAVIINGSAARNLLFNDAYQTPTSGAGNIQSVIDWLKQHVFKIVSTVTADYTVTAFDKLVKVDATAGDVVITLPLGTALNSTPVYIKRIDGSANAVTVVPSGADTIDGGTTIPMTIQYQSYTFIAGSGGYSIV